MNGFEIFGKFTKSSLREHIQTLTRLSNIIGLTNYRKKINYPNFKFKAIFYLRAEVAELVDALGSGSSGEFSIGVQVPASAPRFFSPRFCILTETSSELITDTIFCGRIRPSPSQAGCFLRREALID